MTTDIELLRTDTGELTPVRVVDARDPLTDRAPVLHDLPLAWGDAIEADRDGKPVATWDQFETGLAELRHDVSLGLGEAAAVLQPDSVTPTEVQWAGLPPDPALELAPERLDAEYQGEQSHPGLAEQARRYAQQQELRQAAEQGTATGTYRLPALAPAVEGTYGPRSGWYTHGAAVNTTNRRSLREEVKLLWGDVKRGTREAGRAIAWWRT
jgi:hypothetical protein